jgi:hypothetical protein
MLDSSKGISEITGQFIVRQFSHFVLIRAIPEQITQESP